MRVFRFILVWNANKARLHRVGFYSKQYFFFFAFTAIWRYNYFESVISRQKLTTILDYYWKSANRWSTNDRVMRFYARGVVVKCLIRRTKKHEFKSHKYELIKYLNRARASLRLSKLQIKTYSRSTRLKNNCLGTECHTMVSFVQRRKKINNWS